LPVQEPDVIDSSEWFDQLLEALATPPLVTVLRVNTLKATVHDAQQQLQSVLDQVFCKGMFQEIISHFLGFHQLASLFWVRGKGAGFSP